MKRTLNSKTIALALGVAGCLAERTEMEPAEASLREVSDIAPGLRESYAARDARRYRLGVFDALLRMRPATPAQLERMAIDVAAEIRRAGPGGLEPLLLAAADGVALRGSSEAKERVRAAIAAIGKAAGAQRPINIGAPLGRMGSALVLDLRADAMGALLGALVRATATGGVPTIDDLLGLGSTTDALCALQAQQDQKGRPSPDDQSRAQNCGDHRKPGGKGQRGAAASLGSFVDTACILGGETYVSELQDKANALGACLDEMTGTNGGLAAGGDVPDPLTYPFEELWKYIMDKFVVGPGKDEIDRPFEVDPAWKQAVEKAGEAVAEAVDAEAAWDKAEDALMVAATELQAAEEELERKSEKAEFYAQYGSDEQYQQALKEQAAAAQRVREAQAKKDAAEKAANEAREKAKKEEKEADDAVEDANKKAPKDPGLDGGFMPGSACDTAFGLTDRYLRDKLGDDWKDWKKKLDRVSHPDPQDSGAFGALELPPCGTDPGTVGNHAQACSALVLCPAGEMPDISCGCGGQPSPSAAEITMLLGARCMNTQCPDGSEPVGAGVVCACAPTDTPDQPPKPRPGPEAINALFDSAPRPAESVDPTHGVLRTLFHGGRVSP